MDTVFFIASKLIGALLRPDTWIIIALAIVVLAIIMQRRRLAIWLGSLTLVALATLAILPLGSLLLQPIERSYPANPPLSQVDGIIVLGGGEDVRAYIAGFVRVFADRIHHGLPASGGCLCTLRCVGARLLCRTTCAPGLSLGLLQRFVEPVR